MTLFSSAQVKEVGLLFLKKEDSSGKYSMMVFLSQVKTINVSFDLNVDV